MEQTPHSPDREQHAARVGEPSPFEALVFLIADERFALLLADVIEVQRAVAIRPLPHAPAIVEGIIDVRGELVPVLDLRARFGLPPRALDPSEHLIVAQAGVPGTMPAGGRRRVAVRVDQALGIEQLEVTTTDRAENLSRDLRYVAGVASTPDGLVLIHDLQAFLAQTEALELDRALEAAAAAAESGG